MSTATDLFSAPGKGSREPLAARMRPRKLDEYIGQDHIIGPGRLLRRAIQADQLTSVIFYGPPGTGKTTLARVIANHTKSNFVTLNAVLAGVQQIRDSIAAADDQRKLYDRRTILFVDEVHRWNRAQQDALLPWVENGTIILIGATTENPFFEVNKALVSRSRVFQLKQLTENDLREVANAALADRERGYGRWNVTLESAALDHLVSTASGDARSILNALELAVESSVPSWPPADGTAIHIDLKTAEESIQQKVVLYDRDGDYHYDVISAFIKSLRGRDPDAALYWLARMIAAGEDPGFIFRRMLISASEDTGLADPNAITVVESCARAFDRVGLPEGRFHLTHAALYLATCPKSNSAMAFFDALASVEKEDTEVPNHLRDGNRDAEGFGHGQGYAYPHSYRDHWVAQQYLPDELVGRLFYIPSEQGYEGRIRPEVLNRRELQIAAISDDMDNFESSAGGNVAGGTAGDGTHRAGLAGS
ncbi:MAG: AAA family ATPase, partial [Treponema sp.]